MCSPVRLGVAALALAGVPTGLGAQVPQELLYTGYLEDSGVPYNGAANLGFALYDVASGGTPLWSDTQAGVSVNAGVFTAQLSVPASLLGGAALWLQVAVNGVDLTPRAPLLSVPYAYRALLCDDAGTLAGLAPSDIALQADLTWSSLAGIPLPAGACAVGDVLTWDGAAFACVPDTNAATLCAPGQYLDGDGTCKALSVDLPPDGIDDVSNNIITNVFQTTSASPTTPVPIPDNNPTGVENSFVFPSLGVAQSLTVSINVSNSNTAALRIELRDPDNTLYVLYDNNAAGSSVVATYPTPTPSLSGDLTSWVGRNPTGTWRLRVIDSGFLNNTFDGQINSWSISVQYLSGQSVRVSGNVEILGSLRVADGTQAAGEVLTSDASGNATWQAVPPAAPISTGLYGHCTYRVYTNGGTATTCSASAPATCNTAGSGNGACTGPVTNYACGCSSGYSQVQLGQAYINAANCGDTLYWYSCRKN